MKDRILKCWVGNYDGQREALVISTSQKAAAAIARIPLSSFRDHFWQTESIPDLKPETLYTRDNRNYNRDTWSEGRCTLKPATGGVRG